MVSDDLLLLLDDLGEESAIELIAKYIIQRPEYEDKIANKMGQLLSSAQSTSATIDSQEETRNSSSYLDDFGDSSSSATAPAAASDPTSQPQQQPPSAASTLSSTPPPQSDPRSGGLTWSNLGASLAALVAGSGHKMIFVVNMELNMGRGKQCAQVAHAALGLYLDIQDSRNDSHLAEMVQWMTMGQKKIVVKGNSTEHLKDLKAQAKSAGLPAHLVTDAGCTQIAPGSKTVLALFGRNEELDKITGSLKLL